MDTATFNRYLEDMQHKTVDTLAAKAKEYATEDWLHNFKTAATLEHRTPSGALAGMMAKHTVSVYDLIDRTDRGETVPEEMWAEKIKDSINYLYLLWALVHDEDEAEAQTDETDKPVSQPDKPTVREVRRAAKAGEWIKLTSNGGYSFAHAGEILHVCSFGPNANVRNADHSAPSERHSSNHEWTYLPHEYVVLEGYQPEATP